MSMLVEKSKTGAHFSEKLCPESLKTASPNLFLFEFDNKFISCSLILSKYWEDFSIYPERSNKNKKSESFSSVMAVPNNGASKHIWTCVLFGYDGVGVGVNVGVGVGDGWIGKLPHA